MEMSSFEIENGIDFNDFISQAPTPQTHRPASPYEDHLSWAENLQIFDFKTDIDVVDYNLTNSQKMTFGQPSDPFFAQINNDSLPNDDFQRALMDGDSQHHQQLQEYVPDSLPEYQENFSLPEMQPNYSQNQSQMPPVYVPVVVKEEPIDSVMPADSQSKRPATKCMNRNAIAARENRAKKKQELEELRNRVSSLEKDLEVSTRELKEYKNKNRMLNERCNYLTKFVRSNMRINSLYAQLNSSDKNKGPKRSNIKTIQEPDTGICLHLRSDKKFELRMCAACAAHSGSSPYVPVNVGSETT